MSTMLDLLAFMPQNSLQPAVPFNQDMQVVGALLAPVIEDLSLLAPPTTLVGDVGKCWIVAGSGGTATGAWAGKETQIALATAPSLWVFLPPPDYLRVRILADAGTPINTYYRWNGSTWLDDTVSGAVPEAPNDGSYWARKNETWARIQNGLVIANEETPFVMETEALTLILGSGLGLETFTGGQVRIFAKHDQSLLTVNAEPSLPNSRRAVAGANIVFNDSTPGQRIISAATSFFNKEVRVSGSSFDVVGHVAPVGVGSLSQPAKATGGTINGYLNKRRSTSTTAANNVASFRSGSTEDEVYAATTGSARSAGFTVRMRFGTGAILAGERFFAGLALNAADAGTVDPSALLNCFGIGKDGADANFQIINNDASGAGTKTNLGLAFAANKFFDMELFVPIGGGSWTYTIIDLDTGTVYSATINTNIPTANTPLNWRVWGSTGTTGGSAIVVDLEYVGIRYPL